MEKHSHKNGILSSPKGNFQTALKDWCLALENCATYMPSFIYCCSPKVRSPKASFLPHFSIPFLFLLFSFLELIFTFLKLLFGETLHILSNNRLLKTKICCPQVRLGALTLWAVETHWVIGASILEAGSVVYYRLQKSLKLLGRAEPMYFCSSVG